MNEIALPMLMLVVLAVGELIRHPVWVRTPRLTIAQIEQQRIDTWQRHLPQTLREQGLDLLGPPVVRGTRAAYVYRRDGEYVAASVAFDILHRWMWPQEETRGRTPEEVDQAHQLHKVWVYDFDPLI